MDSVVLTLFTLVFLVGEVMLFHHADVTRWRQGKPLQIPKATEHMILGATVVGALSLTYGTLYLFGPVALQYFYFGVFAISWVATVFFFVPLSNTRFRTLISILAALLLFMVLLSYPYEYIQNIYMAGSLLWVGPVVFRRFDVPIRWFLVTLFVMMLIDAANIWFGQIHTGFSDTGFVANGIIQFGERSLGIGDVFLGYMIVSAGQKYFSRHVAVALAVLMSLPLLARLVFPSLENVVLPYYVVLVPMTYIVFFIAGQMQKVVKRVEREP